MVILILKNTDLRICRLNNNLKSYLKQDGYINMYDNF